MLEQGPCGVGEGQGQEEQTGNDRVKEGRGRKNRTAEQERNEGVSLLPAPTACLWTAPLPQQLGAPPRHTVVAKAFLGLDPQAPLWGPK